MRAPAPFRSLILVAVVGAVAARGADAAPILGTYQAQGVVAEVGDAPDFVLWTFGLSVGGVVALSFTLEDVPASAPDEYDYAVLSWSVIAAPQFYASLWGASTGGSVQLVGDWFELQYYSGGCLSWSGTSTCGIQLEFSAIGVPAGSGLRLPTSTGTWQARVLDSNGRMLLRATSVPEPSGWALLPLSIAASLAGRCRTSLCLDSPSSTMALIGGTSRRIQALFDRPSRTP
ncbi:MAG: hypothetical protein WEF50_00460 [Myxococcota bacterium]